MSRENLLKPLEVYHFLKEQGVEFIQFNPIVERIPDEMASLMGLRHATPHANYEEGQKALVTNFSVEQGVFGTFLTEIFDEWVHNDVGSIHVMNFEWALESWLGLPSTVCIFSEECGNALAIEHNGDMYSCDHYVYPDFRLGNVLEQDLIAMVESNTQLSFGENKKSSLPKQCMECEVKFACHGECPRHRFMRTHDNEPGLDYLCSDYKHYFHHIHRYMKVMVQLIENGLPASKVMDVIKAPIVISNH